MSQKCSSGHQNVSSASFCVVCGLALGDSVRAPSPAGGFQSWNEPQVSSGYSSAGQFTPSSTRPQNGMGIAALVLGIVGFFTCVTAVLAIIFGAIGISKANAGRATNKGMATAGLVLGIVAVGLWVIVIASTS